MHVLDVCAGAAMKTTDAKLGEQLDAFDKMSPAAQWRALPPNDKLLLLYLWGMQPRWQPPAEVLAAYGVTYTGGGW